VSHDTTEQNVLFPDLLEKPLVATFDQTYGSSDGGAILLKACDERLNLTRVVAACLRDCRQQGKVEHDVEALFRQRVSLTWLPISGTGISGQRSST
jgi:hypothetical protein